MENVIFTEKTAFLIHFRLFVSRRGNPSNSQLNSQVSACPHGGKCIFEQETAISMKKLKFHWNFQFLMKMLTF